MDSALRPREIQSRIRAGQSLEEVARASGEHAERIQRFAAPVLAEREHVAGLALTSSVRRRGELGGHRSLRAAVGERLMAHGVDPDTVAWDAWRNKDKRWTVHGTWTQDDEERSARFQFDLVSRFSVADDAESRWLIAEDEESVEHDELALVHAVSGDVTPADSPPDAGPADPDEEPTISLADVPLRFGTGPEKAGWLPRSAATPEEIREELEAEIDAYGLVPDGRSELDVLYDMLSGIAEDSINIYAGLTDPVLSEPVGDVAPPPSEPEPDPEPLKPEPVKPEPIEPEPIEAESIDAAGPQQESSTEASTSPPVGPHPGALTEPLEPRAQDEADSSSERPVDADQDRAATDAEGDERGPTGDQPDFSIGQPPLVDNEPTIQVAPGAAKRQGARKKRASVPSWDEIMFGGPKRD